jgi:hypothetical protein
MSNFFQVSVSLSNPHERMRHAFPCFDNRMQQQEQRRQVESVRIENGEPLCAQSKKGK